MAVADEINQLFASRGSNMYFGEAITEEQHALQAAHLAENAGAPDELIVAALLHDVGHLLHDRGEDVAERGEDARHEDIGHTWLIRHFGPAVADPVRLHVAAKRYLCATNSTYRSTLSPASEKSLILQGGPMSPAEVAAYDREPHGRAALRLRVWDDGAKVVDWQVPLLSHYRSRIERVTVT